MIASVSEENFFISPCEMNDEELEREYAALYRFDREVMTNDKVADFWKHEIREHAKAVIDECQARNGAVVTGTFENF